MGTNGNANGHEKTPFQSKKFVAFLWADATLKVLAVLLVAWAWNLDEISTRVFFLLLAVIVISGFVTVGYILGVASLDKYVRLAQITGNVVTKTITAGPGLPTSSSTTDPAPTEDEEDKE
jgi:hypothetical protein